MFVKYIRYYCSIENDKGTFNKYLETTDDVPSPFVELDNDTWTDIDIIPSDADFIKKVETEETDEEGNITVTVISYYSYSYFKEAADKDPVVCAVCAYHITGRGFKKHQCCNKHHVIKDFVSGKEILGNCRDFNSYGQCPYFEENVEPEPTPEPEYIEVTKENFFDLEEYFGYVGSTAYPIKPLYYEDKSLENGFISYAEELDELLLVINEEEGEEYYLPSITLEVRPEENND